jgi:8-oxo-dGTP pyrophosphatase MutT (NUDIX family)
VEPIATREVFAGKLLRVAVESWPAGEREVVHHPGACAVVALTAEREILLVRQVREVVRERLLEIPAGIFDVDGEDPAGCAARELLEETGYRAVRMEPLGWVYTSPGFTDERIALFRADAVQAGASEDGIEVVRLPVAGGPEAIRDGRIRDLKTVAGVLLAAAEAAVSDQTLR